MSALVVVSTSPIPSHPSAEIIEETLRSIEERCDWPILIVADGVRPELEHRRAAYEEYLQKLSVLAVGQRWLWRNRLAGDPWLHQARAVATALHRWELGREGAGMPVPPALLFMEHDTPLVGEVPLDDMADMVAANFADVVRLYHEKLLQPEHAQLFYPSPEEARLRSVSMQGGGPFVRTRQWSQRPHVARWSYYRRMLEQHFPESSRTMIEDRMHSVAQSAPEEHRIWLYLPEGDYPGGLGTQRSDHLDGRGADPKFEMRYE